MATKVVKKPRQLTLFFDSKESCQYACELLGLSLRKVSDIDRTHDGDYSKLTGHYGFKFRNGNTVRVKLRSKLMIDEDMYTSLAPDEKAALGHLSVTSVGWIAP